jgi:protein Mpv17
MQLAKFKAKSLYLLTAKKVAADQLVAAPAILVTVMSAVSLMEGHTVEQTKEKLKHDYLEVLLTNYKVSQLLKFPHMMTDLFVMQN